MLSKKLRGKLLSERSSYPDDPFDGTPKLPDRTKTARERPDDCESRRPTVRGHHHHQTTGHRPTARELDILRILTSPEWSRGPFPETAVNVRQLANRELPMDSRGTPEEEESREVGAAEDDRERSPDRETGVASVVGESHETDQSAARDSDGDPESDRETINDDEGWPSGGGVDEQENAYVPAEPSGNIANNGGGRDGPEEHAAKSLESRSGDGGTEADDDQKCAVAAVAPSSESSRGSCESLISARPEDGTCSCGRSGSSRRSVPRDYSKEQEPTLNYENCVMPDYHTSSETMFTTAFMERFDMDLFNKYYDSETNDSSSMWSNIPAMTQIIRQNKSEENPESNKMVYLEAIEMILKNAKITLGSLLVEGLYLVAKDHREDPFRYLGQWLLIQADIRDEKLKESAEND